MTQVVGGEILAAMLAAEGVDTAFGIVDGTYLGLLAGFEKHGIRLVSPRHETSAAHMAAAYARLTGRLGVCIASNGPGVANVLPGVAVENAEGNRVLLVTSHRRTGIVGPDRGGAYQYFDQTGVTRAMTRWSGLVPSFARLPELTRKALRAAFHGRPGVVHLDVPEDVMNGAFEGRPEILAPEAYRRTAPVPAPAEQVEAAARLLATAERPVIHAGSGVLHARAFDALTALAEALNAPVTTSWSGRGAIAETNAWAIPVPALEAVDAARRDADVVLVLGSRLGETDWWGKAPYWGRGEQKVIQVDVDEEILGLNKPVTLGVVADLGAFLPALLEAVRAHPAGEDAKRSRAERLESLGALRRKARAELDMALENEDAPMHSSHVATTCRKIFDDDAILVVDGGNTAVWATFFHEVRVPNTVLSTFKFGMLGAGVAQALGAKVAFPDRDVYCILGDGAMGFHPQEVETAVRAGLPVTWLVLSDRQWGMVKLTQQLGLGALRETMGSEHEGTVNADLGEIAWDDLARSMGAHGERVSAPKDLGPALERAKASGKPAVIQVDVDPAMHLFAPGLQQFKAMHQEPEG